MLHKTNNIFLAEPYILRFIVRQEINRHTHCIYYIRFAGKDI